jgi:hypothetical protein
VQSTLGSYPLTVAAILRRACDVHGDRTVTTATGGGCRYNPARQTPPLTDDCEQKEHDGRRRGGERR